MRESELWQNMAIQRYNFQNAKGKSKSYQVRQVLKAIERLEVENGYKK